MAGKMNIIEKAAFYNQSNFRLINSYIENFKLATDNYESERFESERQLVILIREKIARRFSIPSEKVCEFAFNYHYRTYVINGILMSNSLDHLYFIESDNHIKIGRSDNVIRRLGHLQVSSPEKLKIKKVIYHKGCYEFDIHYVFDYLRVNGEWFVKSDDIYKYIDLIHERNTIEFRRYGSFINHEKGEMVVTCDPSKEDPFCDSVVRWSKKFLIDSDNILKQ